MSWAAHELESYFLQKHIKARVSYLAILSGCLLPDMFTKLPVYGLHIGPIDFHAATHPYEYHRGWPGVGFTHSLLFGLLFAALILWVTKSRAWFIGIWIGAWAHVLTDMFDSVGTMVFFPFTTQHYTTGMWAYAAQQGKYGDAAAYYGSLGGVWDFFWLIMAISGFSVFSKRYFFDTVVPADPAWGWLRRRLHLSETAMLALYRAFFLYGACRIFGWFIWAQLVKGAPLDWSWGGPYWVTKVSSHYGSWTSVLQNTVVGAVGLAVAMWVLWLVIGKRLWNRADRGLAVVPVAAVAAGSSGGSGLPAPRDTRQQQSDGDAGHAQYGEQV